jgi:hypothetical protein
MNLAGVIPGAPGTSRCRYRGPGSARRWLAKGMLVIVGSLSASFAVSAALPAAAATDGGLKVVNQTSIPAGVHAVVMVPPSLTGIRLSNSDWRASAYGPSLPLSTSRIAGPRLQVVLVLDRSPGTLAAEQIAAVEFLHRLPALTPVTVAGGKGLLGSTRDAALNAVSDPRASGKVETALSRANLVPRTGARRAIVVFARCSALPNDLGGMAPHAFQELDIVGLGSSCSWLNSLVADWGGVLVKGTRSPDGLTAAADHVADRLLGEYDVSVQGSSDTDVTLTVHAAGQRLSTDIGFGYPMSSSTQGTRAPRGSQLDMALATVAVLAIAVLALRRT